MGSRIDLCRPAYPVTPSLMKCCLCHALTSALVYSFGVVKLCTPAQYEAEDSDHVVEIQRLLAVAADTYKGLAEMAVKGGTSIPRDGIIPPLPAAACEPGWDEAATAAAVDWHDFEDDGALSSRHAIILHVCKASTNFVRETASLVSASKVLVATAPRAVARSRNLRPIQMQVL